MALREEGEDVAARDPERVRMRTPRSMKGSEGRDGW